MLHKFNLTQDADKFKAALQYLEDNKGAFKLVLDYSRLRIQAFLFFVHKIGRETQEAKTTIK